MSDQLDLFEATYPSRPGHVPDCDTSEAAANSLDDTLLTRLRGRIFALIPRAPHGFTCDEIEMALGLHHQTLAV